MSNYSDSDYVALIYCPNKCSGHGACVRQSNGDEACLCGVGHFGNDCSRVAAVSEGSNGGVVVVVIVAFLLVGGALLALFIYLKFKHHLVCVMDETNSSDSETEAILRIEEVIEETDEPTEPFDLRLPEEKTGDEEEAGALLGEAMEENRAVMPFTERKLQLDEVKKNVPMKKEEDSMAIDHIIKGGKMGTEEKKTEGGVVGGAEHHEHL